MGKRNRDRIQRIRRGEGSSFREKKRFEELERLAEKYGGEAVAEELEALGQEGRIER